MKKIIFFFCLAFTLNANAQTIFEQDFEAGIAPMTLVDVDMQTPHENVAEYAAAWTVDNPLSGNGTNVAVSNSWYTPTGVANDWMITPAIEITTDTFMLEWDAKAVDLNFPDGYKVLVSIGDTTLSNFTTEIFSITNESGNWAHHAVSLAAFTDMTIHIAFLNNSNNQFLLYIDNIIVRIAPVIEGSLVTNDEPLKILDFAGDTKSLDFKYTNTGTEEVNSFDFVYTVDGGAEVSVAATEPLAAGASITLPVNDLALGEHNISATIQNINGTGINSNTVDFTLIVEVPVPAYAGTDVNGNAYDLHQLLADGKTVILNFFTSACSPCETAAPILNEAWVNLGSGNGDVEAFGLSVEPTDDDTVILGLDWGVEYPTFAYSADNEYFWSVFNYQFGNGGIPLFVMICPNPSSPAFSAISWSNIGAGIATTQIESETAACLATPTVDVSNTYGVNIYPNPVSAFTNIEFDMPTAKNVNISILNSLGQIVDTKNLGFISAGFHTTAIDMHTKTAGIYQILIQFGDKFASKKITVIK